MSDAASARDSTEGSPTASDDGYVPPTLDSLAVKLAQLTALVNNLIERVDAASSQARVVGKPTPLDWSSISGAERAAAWRELGDFVEALVNRYNLHDQLLPCWWRHGEAIEELTSLWLARQEVYQPGNDRSIVSWWHDLLERTRMRLQTIQILCRHGHTNPEPKQWMTDEERAAFLAAEN